MRPGEPLGNRYRLEHRVATGGLGEVWRAVDTKLRRPVALKILHPSLARDDDFRERFVHETRAVAAVRAPGVVNLYDVCEEPLPDGSLRCYLVMEFVAGQSLAAVMATQERLPTRATLWLVAQIADALEAAHQAGVLHRDVKPGNILVGPDNAVTVVDFGIARVSGTPGLTAGGMVMGTLSYASPEHLLGRELTPASDIYSLGVIAYECLAGRLPFITTSPAATITSQLRDSPPPLPADVPSAVSRLVLRALAKKPDDRFVSAAEFAQACRKAAAELPPTTRKHAPRPRPRPRPSPTGAHRTVSGPQPSTPGKTARPTRPTRQTSSGVVLATALVTAIIATVAGIGLWRGPVTPTTDHVATPPDQSATPVVPRGPAPAASPIAIVSQRPRCLATTSGSNVRFAPCQGVTTFTFHAVAGRSDTYQITPTSRAGMCLHLDGAGMVRVDTCRASRAWRFTWLATVDGWHHWRLQYVGTQRCLGMTTEPTPAAGPCTGTNAVRWRTKAS